MLFRSKLSVLESVVKDKRIVLVDDSIVRGTTIANLIHMLKEAGAKEVHVRISSPPFLHPCYFGTDVPSNDQLIAASHSTEEICKMIGADSLGYMQTDYLEELNPSEKVLRVMQRMISPAWTERQLSENLFFAGEIADRVPVLHLFCTKNTSAACVMKNTIDQLEELQ